MCLMNVFYRLKFREDLKTDAEQQNGSLQTMLDWKKGEEPEFSATLRLYLAARRFLRHIQKTHLFMLPLVANSIMRDMPLLVA